MMTLGSAAARLKLLGGDLCLDFANTVGNHNGDKPSEHLASYVDLVAWSQHAGVLSNRVAQRLVDVARRNAGDADQVFSRALTLREAIYRIFLAIAEEKSPKPADLDTLNQELADSLAHSQIVSINKSFTLDWSDEKVLDRMIWYITRSAADLLTSGNLDRVRQCGDESCGWLFIDTSKNHSRRWCDMNDCGNRNKARRHYSRVKATTKS